MENTHSLSDVISGSRSRYAQQILNGYSGFGFDDHELEIEFRNTWRSMSMRKVRIALLLALILTGIFSVYDFLIMPPEVLAAAQKVRAIIFAPLVICGLALVRSNKYKRWLFPLAMLFSIIGGLSIVSIVLLSYSMGFDLAYEGLMLVIMYIFFFCGLLTREAMISAGLVISLYTIGAIWIEYDAIMLGQHSLFLVSALTVGAAAAWGLEYTVRGGFLRAQLLNEVAERDGLTSLNNRRYFDLSYRQLIKDCNLHGHSVAVAMFDVDHFKTHNDQHGHQFGDRVIQAVAEGLASGSDTRPALLARYGGDEFVAVWTGHSSSDAVEAVQQMRDAVKKVAQRNLSIETKVKISAGLAWSYAPFDGEQMLKTADDALYKAKTEGRDRLVTIAD